MTSLAQLSVYLFCRIRTTKVMRPNACRRTPGVCARRTGPSWTAALGALKQLVEVPAQRLVPAVRRAVDALLGGVRLLIVRIAVTDRALAALHIAERVVDAEPEVSTFLTR